MTREPLLGQLAQRTHEYRMPVTGNTLSISAPIGSAGSAVDCVLLVERSSCGELATLHRALRRTGVPSIRITEAALPDLDVAYHHADSALSIQGVRVRPVVTWSRQLNARGVPGTADPALAMFRADSWCALIDQVAAISPHRIPQRRPGRLEQLRRAAEVGLSVPRTWVTTDPAAASRALGPGPVVVKVLDEHFAEVRPGTLVGVFPEFAEQEEAAHWQPVRAPVIVQEAVPHEEVIRVFCLGSACVAFASPPGLAGLAGLNGTAGPVRAVELPEPVAAKAIDLTRKLGLSYGALDLLASDSGDYVFLEINVDGDWRWYESRAGVNSVSTRALAMVRGLFAESADPLAPVGLFGLLSACHT